MRPAYNPFYVPEAAPRAGPPRLSFSRTELLHLAGAVAVLTLCFSIVVGGFRDEDRTFFDRLLPDPIDILAAFFAVATGFVLHELAHKVVAQRYGHWAEFRAKLFNLLASYALVLGTGWLFAAPGAVFIQGQVTRRENGIISLVGPGVNFVIGVITWRLSWTSDAAALVPRILGVVATVNALLAAFNLIPLGPLDGKKVMRWNGAVYAASVALALVLCFMVLVYPNGLAL